MPAASASTDHSLEQRLLLLAGVMQGVALVTFPAISTVLTSDSGYGLSSSTYGLIFLPQVIAAISASILGGQLSRSWGVKKVLLLGLMADLASMGVLLLSAIVMRQQAVALPLLMTATALMGLGFGGVVPALNTLIANFQPLRVDAAILMLNALLGLGTALAPALAALVVGPGIWWVLPLLVLLSAAILWYACRRQPLLLQSAGVDTTTHSAPVKGSLPLLVLFLLVAVLYGLAETLNGNWSVILMSRRVGSTEQIASLSLTLFWAMVTLGRLFFARFSTLFPPRRLLPGLPVFLAAIFLGISRLTQGDSMAGLLLFGLSGFGCSAMLPAIISLGQKRLVQLGESTSGVLIAAYQFGYGLAAFGGGAVQQTWHLPISSLFSWGAGTSLALALAAGCISVPGLLSGSRQAP